MIYTYYRVSTDKQDYNNQKFGVMAFCNSRGFTIDREIVDEGVSGKVKVKDRALGKEMRRFKDGDMLIVSELSRIGRSTADVINTCQELYNRGVSVYFVKQGLSLSNTPIGKMMITFFSAFAELERDLLIQRVKEALDRKKAEGVHLGRKFGFTYRRLNEKDVRYYIEELGYSKSETARQLNCDWRTLHRFMKERKIPMSVRWKNGVCKEDVMF